MPKITNWVVKEINFNGTTVEVATKSGFTRVWEKGTINLNGTTVEALVYRTDDVGVYLHTDVLSYSGDNAVTVDYNANRNPNIASYDDILHDVTNVRLSDGGNAVYTVEDIIEFALGKDALEWA